MGQGNESTFRAYAATGEETEKMWEGEGEGVDGEEEYVTYEEGDPFSIHRRAGSVKVRGSIIGSNQDRWHSREIVHKSGGSRPKKRKHGDFRSKANIRSSR
jgi:hypothetical protein